MIDIGILLLVFLLAWKGYFNGLMRELVGFIGLIGGIFVASRAADPLAKVLAGILHMGNPALLKLLAFLLVLGIIWGGSAFVGTIFVSLRAHPQTIVSRISGMLLAGVKYFLIFSLISASLTGSALIRDNFAHTLDQSRLLPVLNRVGSLLINLPSPTAGKPLTKGQKNG